VDFRDEKVPPGEIAASQSESQASTVCGEILHNGDKFATEGVCSSKLGKE